MRSSGGAVLLPSSCQVALTFAILFWLGGSRFAALKARQVKVACDRARRARLAAAPAADPERLPQSIRKPVLFYVLVALALFTRQADMLFVVMSWMFVVARFVHAAIHTTSNVVSRRFMASWSRRVLGIMWVIFAVRILALGRARLLLSATSACG